MISRRATGLVAAAGLAAAALPRPARAQPASDVLARIRASGTLRVGVVAGQPPYCYRSLATGEWSGFVLDAAADLAAELGAHVEPVESTWGNAVLDVLADKVDIFFGLAATPQRARAVTFTKPLYENAFALLARSGFSPASWGDVNDESVRVAVELGTVYDQTVATLCPRATLTRLKTNNDASMTVAAGRADCQIIVVVLALTALARNPQLGHLVVPQPVFAVSTSAIMAKNADPAWPATVDDWITRRRHAGQLRAMLVANLEKVGVPAADIPPQLLF